MFERTATYIKENQSNITLVAILIGVLLMILLRASVISPASSATEFPPMNEHIVNSN